MKSNVTALDRVGHWIYTRCVSTYASSMAQRVKNLPAMQETQETWVQSLSWEDPLEEEMATHSSIFAWEIPATVHGIKKTQTRLSD